MQDTDESTTATVAEPVGLANTGYEIFIAALTVLSIVNLVLIFAVHDESLEAVLFVMNAVLSGVLFLDFVRRLLTAPSKSDYFWRNFGWADLLASLPIPQVKILRLFRLLKVWRLAREYGARRLLTALVKDRAESALYLLLLVAVLVLEFGSLAMLSLEKGIEGANIETASDSIWYVLVTISTVGYGDQFPVSTGGRVLGTFIIILGVGIFGTLTGFLANAFISPSTSDDDAQDAARSAAADDALADRVEDLHRMMAEQQATIARLEGLLTAR